MKRMDTSRMTAEAKWFSDQERKLIEKIREEREAEIKKRENAEAEDRRQALKEQHWLCCPKCGHGMEEEQLFNIHVDICTFCEGIYFDRGELEELLLFQREQNRGFFRALLGLK
jgi:uncharacterized protein